MYCTYYRYTFYKLTIIFIKVRHALLSGFQTMFSIKENDNKNQYMYINMNRNSYAEGRRVLSHFIILNTINFFVNKSFIIQYYSYMIINKCFFGTLFCIRYIYINCRKITFLIKIYVIGYI